MCGSSQCVDKLDSYCNVGFHKPPRCPSPTSFNFPFRIVRTMMTDRMTGIDNPPTLCCDGPITCQDLFPIYLFPKLQKTQKSKNIKSLSRIVDQNVGFVNHHETVDTFLCFLFYFYFWILLFY